MLKHYRVKLQSDQGPYTLDVSARSEEAARAIVCEAEGCPMRAIRSVRPLAYSSAVADLAAAAALV